ncbi:unnamed protein product, partial [Rotaria sp. Silwood2]
MARTTNAQVLDAVERIYNSGGISKLFEEKYPSVNELLKYNFEGTVGVLSFTGVLQIFDLDTFMRCQQIGNNNLKTWVDYKDKIEKYLREQLNDDRRLEAARLILAQHIYSEHYRKFPYWPTVKEHTQQSEIFLDLANSYPFETWFVGWSCLGYITVQDIRKETNSFYTDFLGKPDVKVLFCNERKISALEQSASSDMDAAKESVDEFDQPITFKKLKQDLRT